MTKKQKPDTDGWTPDRLAQAKKDATPQNQAVNPPLDPEDDPRKQDPANWISNPVLSPEDEAALDKVDQERVAEAMVERALKEQAEKKDGKKTKVDPKDADSRFVSFAGDGGMIFKDEAGNVIPEPPYTGDDAP